MGLGDLVLNSTTIVALGLIAAFGVFIALIATSRTSPQAREAALQRARDAGLGETAEPKKRRYGRQRERLADTLNAAGIKVRASEFRGIQVAAALVLGAIGMLRFGQVIPALIVAIIGWIAPRVYLQYRRNQAREAVNQQLSEVLTTLSNSLKAGLNLPQSLETVARSGVHPMSDEFARVVREIAMGATIEQALTNLVRRTRNEDLELAVTAILIHNTIGGNLASVLESIETTLRTRQTIASELTTLTAQSRASAWVITLLPVGVASLLLLVAPTYFTPMIQTDLGRLLLIICGMSILLGNYLIRRTIRLEV